MSNINFDNPYLLLIAVPLIVLFTIPFVLAVRKDNRNGHNVTSQILHVVLAIIIGFAAAGTKITTVLTETHVYVVADVSYSANKNLDTIDNIIRDQLVLPRNSKIGVITFGKDSEVLSDLVSQRDQKNLKSVKESTVDQSETNIAEALIFAGEQFEQDVIKRIVLITDAKQTDEEDTTAMRRAVDMLYQQEIKVDAFYLDDNLNSDTHEVQISSADFTRSAFINHKETVRVNIQSNCVTRGVIELYMNGNLVQDEDGNTARRVIEIVDGQNVVSFNLKTDESGTYDYEVRLVNMEDDHSDYNNTYSFTQTVSAERKVLMITTEWSDCNALLDQYGNDVMIDLYENTDDGYNGAIKDTQLYAKYVNNDNINVYCFDRDLKPAGNVVVKDVPYTIEDLCKYDQIILSDLNFSLMPEGYRGDFVSSVNAVVEKFGKSLITLGDIEGGDVASDLGKMLPVRFGKSEDAPKLYTIVLDASFSMFEQNKIGLAKSIATKLVGTMQDSDHVCIVYFDGDSWMLSEPTPVTKPDEIVAKITNLDIRQGTRIDAGLRRAYERISGSTIYSDKMLVLITDGENASNSENLDDIVTDMYSEEIVTSVVYLYLSESTKTYEQQLRNLANIGHGTYNAFNATVSNDIDDVAFGRMTESMMETLYEGDPRSVQIAKTADDVLANIPDTLPGISGYMISVAKASATTVLNVNHIKPTTGAEKQVPLYSYWNHGKGKVASFTSKITGNWLALWDQTVTDTLLDNVLETNVPNEKTDYPYTFNVVRDGSFTYVQVVPENPQILRTTVTMKLTLPDGSNSERVLVWDESQFCYSDRFKSAEVGRYEIEVTYTYNNVNHKAVSVFYTAFSSEYDEFATYEASPLFRALNGRGQVVFAVTYNDEGEPETGTMTLVNDEHEVGTYTNDLTVPLLIIAVVLFIVDIVVRKLKWEDVVSFFGGFKKQEKESK